MLANAKWSWWNASGSLEFSQLATAKNTADTAYQSGVNTAYTTWSASTALAAEVYARALATGEFNEQTGNINGLRDYLHTQADVERDWHLAQTTARVNDLTRIVTATPDAYSNGSNFNNVWTLPASDRLNDFYLRDLGWWGFDFTGRNASHADYSQRAVPADSARRIGVMDRRFSGLHESKTAEHVYQESLQNAEQVYIASEGAANVTRAGSVATANAQSAADNATTWATALTTLLAAPATIVTPWLTLAKDSAIAEKNYLTTLVTPTGTYHSTLATAEKDYAKALSGSRYVGTQQTFYQRWAEDLTTTHYSFNNPNTYYSHYRNEANWAVTQAGRTNLSPPNISYIEQVGDHQTIPANNSAAATPSGQRLPEVLTTALRISVFPLLETPKFLANWLVSGAYQPFGIDYGIPRVYSPSDDRTTTPQLTDLKDGTKRQPHRVQNVVSSGPVSDVMNLNLDLEVPAPTNFQELYNKHKSRLVNLKGEDGIEFVKGIYEGFKDSFLDTVQLVGSVVTFAAKWGAYGLSETGGLPTLIRQGITNLTGKDPFEEQERTIEWLQQVLASTGNSMSPSQVAAFAAKNAIALAKNLKKFEQQMVQSAVDIQIFLDQHGKELATAIENGDLDEITRLKQYLPKELRGALDYVYSTAISLLDDLADAVTPRNLGYLTGMLLYEYAEDAALTAAWSAFSATTLGAGVTAAPALAASKAAIFLRRFEKAIGKLDPGIQQKVLKTMADAIWAVAKRFEICFVAGTLVHTERGLRPIEEVVKDDLVFARTENDPTGQIRLRRVKQTFVTHPTRLYHVTYRTADGREETLSGTGEHPYFVVGQGFVPAKLLAEGDEFSLIGGEQACVVGLGTEDAAAGETFTTYNFEVEEDHTYFVGELGAWVHNAGTICGEAVESLLKRADAAELAMDSGKLRKAVQEELREKAEDAIRDAAGDPATLKQIVKEFEQHERDAMSAFQKAITQIDPKNILDDTARKAIWDIDVLKRGIKIEKHLGATDYKDWWHIGAEHGGSFPLIDFVKDMVAVSVKTVDTRGVSWVGRMEEHIRDLFRRRPLINGGPAKEVILDLRVQPGGLNDAQSLVDYGMAHGIKVIVKEF